jgi:glycerophosphoryl diester phosphodiesterase
MNFKTLHISTVLLAFGFLSLFQGCKKDSRWKIDNLNGGRITILGHAGCGFASLNNPVPENSMASIKKAIGFYNAEGVEVDVQLSADNILFLYHDTYLNTATDFQGCIRSHSAAELNTCQYNNSDEKLASLEECLSYCAAQEYPPAVFIDTRLDLTCETNLDYYQFIAAYAESLYEIITEYHAESWVSVESSDPDFLNLIKAKNNSIALYLDDMIPDNINIVLQNQFRGIVVSNRKCTAEQIKEAHSKGIYICIFEAYTRAELKDAIKKSPDIIQADNITLLKSLLQE